MLDAILNNEPGSGLDADLLDAPTQVVCLYHDDCYDGTGAAWALSKRFPDAELISVRYKEPAPDAVRGKIVYIVDFCYPLSELLALTVLCEELHVLDHHQGMDTTIEQYNWLIKFLGFNADKYNAVFDQNRSGALLTWETLLPQYPAPQIIRHISDRDLWRFELDETEAVMAGLGTYRMEVKRWDRLFRWDHTYDPDDAGSPHQQAIADLERDGHPILRKMEIDIERLVGLTLRKIELEGYTVPLVNMPRTLTSEALGILAKENPFAVGYFDTADYREFSLRSAPEGVNLIPIAKALGGGGHSKAAGFRVSRDHPLAQL